MGAHCVLNPSACVSTMADNLPVAVRGKSLWEMSHRDKVESGRSQTRGGRDARTQAAFILLPCCPVAAVRSVAQGVG